jgi:hypothetical protein
MIRLFAFISMLLCIASLSYACPTNSGHKQKLTAEQKKMAQFIGVILPGFTKEEVRETYSSLLEPKIWFTTEGTEVWYFKAPQEQNIYFTNDIVVYGIISL